MEVDEGMGGARITSMMRIFALPAIVVAVVIVTFGSALALVAVRKALIHVHPTTCSSRLMTLSRMQALYRTRCGEYPTVTGREYWLEIVRQVAHAGDATELLDCPRTDARPAEGDSEYDGPASDVNAYGPGDPVAADRPGAHGNSLHVLRKDGAIMSFRDDDPAWRDLRRKVSR